MIPDRHEKMFNEFHDAVRSNDILDVKTTLLLHLATSMAVGCGP